MKKLFDFFIGLILFLIAWALFLPLSVVNFIIVSLKGKGGGYFYSSAVSFDKYGNRELRTLWNTTLRKPDGYPFGDERETISSALGKNERDGTLALTGKVLVWVLHVIDRNHAAKSIREL